MLFLNSIEETESFKKGNEYLVLHIARHSETLEEYVVYQALYGERGIWIRPLEMFLGTKDVDGKQVLRFEEIEDVNLLNLSPSFGALKTLAFIVLNLPFSLRVFDIQANPRILSFPFPWVLYYILYRKEKIFVF